MQGKNVNKLICEDEYSAFNPEACVFVSANAGSGKTSLLANRVLSLLLHGVEPAKILCLTFTNAAAAEMSNRVLKALGLWVMADASELQKQITKLIGSNPSDALLAHARGLFASVLEAPQGVNIQTIHGFSQSLLRRFPLESGVSPHFTVMDGRSEQEALSEARLRLFNSAQKNDSNIKKSLESLARMVGESSFHKLLNEIIGNKRKFRHLLQNVGGLINIEYLLCNKLGVSVNETAETLIDKYFVYDERQLFELRKIADILLQSEKKSDSKTGNGLVGWLEKIENKAENIDEYIDTFLTQKGEKLKIIFTKAILTDDSDIESLLTEQQRVYEFSNSLRALNVKNHSMDVMNIAEALLANYEAIKRSHGWMDYDDLIMISCDLLTRFGMSPWVLFKLDGGIDHILVDEAQDTSPQQWQIVDALTKEFFAGQGAKENSRSLFVVGDEKQSIYSFQGANVKELARMQKYFSESIKAAQKTVHHLSLVKSYRSTESVLKTVDSVFSNLETRCGVVSGDVELKHIIARVGQVGVVELWPLFKLAEDDGENAISPVAKLVLHIADTIKGWIENGEAKAGEVMILLRSRTVLADRLVRALKRRGVPVAGSDRMALNDNLAVQDLVALGQVLLLPDDDLTLAACLKSPIFNISEDDLFELSYSRGKQSLWQRLGQNVKFADSYELLVELRAKADFILPFELYSYLLDNCGARARFVGRMGGECADPLDEFLQQILLYERSHPPSLQGFIHWLSGSNSLIKRDMEQAKDAVRIMTIHGAKGLQAKVVILPDTVSTPMEQDSLLWLDDNIPIRSTSSDKGDMLCKQLRADRQEETYSEYRRLLYVALTRAEDRLYIFGAAGKDKISDKSWYHHIKTGMTYIAETFDTKFGDGLRVGFPCHPAPLPCHPASFSCHPALSPCHPALSPCHPALVAGAGAANSAIGYVPRPRNKCGVTEEGCGEAEECGVTGRECGVTGRECRVTGRVCGVTGRECRVTERVCGVTEEGGVMGLEFLQSPVPVEPSPSRPLVPSRDLGELPATASPLVSKTVYAAGNFVHLLLQHLPVLEVEKRKESAKIIACKFASMLSMEVIDKAIADVLAVIDNPKFAFLFSKDTLVEVPITGNVLVSGNNITVSGQIDRLHIGSDEVWIVDFKSNALPPASQKNIPVAYIRQLALYRLLMQQITPEKTVYCALLWVATAKLDVLPNALLDEWQASS